MYSSTENPVRMQFIFILRGSIIVHCLSSLNSCFEANQAGMSLIYHFIMKRFPFQEAFKSGSSVCPHRKFLCSNFPKKEISLRSEPSSCLWAELFEETLACKHWKHPWLVATAGLLGSTALLSYKRAETPLHLVWLLLPLPHPQTPRSIQRRQVSEFITTEKPSTRHIHTSLGFHIYICVSTHTQRSDRKRK